MSFEKLFAEWKERFSFHAFIREGIVDGNRYEEPHILFVLRDMNCQSERDLCADLRQNGSGWKTWNNIGRWTKALLDGCEEYPWAMSKDKRVEQLKRVAVMNLKKEGGTSRANGRELEKSVKEQKEMIFKEICLCDPSVMICCGLTASGILGNAALLKDYVFDESTEWKSLKSENLHREWWYYYTKINGKDVPVVSFCHPQVTCLGKARGHEALFIPLYKDMLRIRSML